MLACGHTIAPAANSSECTSVTGFALRARKARIRSRWSSRPSSLSWWRALAARLPSSWQLAPQYTRPWSHLRQTRNREPHQPHRTSRAACTMASLGHERDARKLIATNALCDQGQSSLLKGSGCRPGLSLSSPLSASYCVARPPTHGRLLGQPLSYPLGPLVPGDAGEIGTRRDRWLHSRQAHRIPKRASQRNHPVRR